MKTNGHAGVRRRSRDSASAGRSHYAECRLFLVGKAANWKRWTGKANTSKWCLLESGDEVRRGIAESPHDSVWIARSAAGLFTLARFSVQGTGNRRLIVLGEVDELTHHMLAAWFRFVVVGMSGLSLLPPREMLEVLQASNRDDLFVAGALDRRGRVLVLYRGSVQPLVVPLDWFRNSAAGIRPDPENLQIIDYGQTIKLGDFEVSADAMLFEFDDSYRTRAKKRLIQSDASLGGAIRRLRLQRGLSRSDFASVPVRTMARIERGEVSRPQRSTLLKIAQRLGVPVDSLGTY